MSDIIKFIDLDWRNGMLFMAAVIIVAVFILQKTEWLAAKFGITSKRQLAEDKRDQEILELKEHAKSTDGNFAKICKSIEELKEDIKNVSKQVGDMQERNNESERNALRDRIGQSYRYYKAKGEWNMMEKEAFFGLVHSYEQAGGKNGFVHDTCIPRAMEFNIVDE